MTPTAQELQELQEMQELLEEWRADQHDDVALPCDHRLAAFLHAADPDVVLLERVTRVAPVEALMIGKERR